MPSAAAKRAWYERRKTDPAFLAQQAARMRVVRAAMTPEQRDAYLAEKRERAQRDRLDPNKRARQNEQARAAYRRVIADPARRARRLRSERARYWKNQPWRIAQEARLRAQKRGLEYNLTKEWVAETWTGKCALTGIPFARESSSITPYSPTIDRVDNTRGYSQDNCRWVLYGVNALKNNGTDKDVITIARALLAGAA